MYNEAKFCWCEFADRSRENLRKPTAREKNEDNGKVQTTFLENHKNWCRATISTKSISVFPKRMNAQTSAWWAAQRGRTRIPADGELGIENGKVSLVTRTTEKDTHRKTYWSGSSSKLVLGMKWEVKRTNRTSWSSENQNYRPTWFPWKRPLKKKKNKSTIHRQLGVATRVCVCVLCSVGVEKQRKAGKRKNNFQSSCSVIPFIHILCHHFPQSLKLCHHKKSSFTIRTSKRESIFHAADVVCIHLFGKETESMVWGR